ncbi:alanine racemase [Ruania suaedae]|uniref:alanine racemase n=1 Tax=Ruania suaedae TaxID=2897774 RepID=UPI001E3F9F80|nr:alanine racemase [Ruania suaedae]UFU03643.1 alanine racemase [Ruania suaedae]
MTSDPRALVHGIAPLTARTEPWMDRLLADPERCVQLLEEFGSPVNLLDFRPLERHVRRLHEVAVAQGVDLGVFVARKANKAVGLIDAARAAGAGVDVASWTELDQSLRAGMPCERIIVSAAVKDRRLLATALESGAVLSIDNRDELTDLIEEAGRSGLTARVALRLSIVAPGVAATRFGLPAQQWMHDLDSVDTRHLNIVGLHFHLHGYAVADRVAGLREAMKTVPILRAQGHPVRFVDMGGGLPVRYLADERQWRDFWYRLGSEPSRLTWRGDTLGMTDPTADRPSPEVYPFWQPLDAGTWLHEVLTSHLDQHRTVAEGLAELELALHCEPGRAMLDGCGLTLARVAFRKQTSDGEPLVGLFMNRTQMRSTSRDVLLDPLWIRPDGGRPPSEPGDGFLVGAYCIEEELLLRRRLRFPAGVGRDDIAVFVNTGGYLMHILESPSHQLPLAATVVADGGSWRRDAVDL